MIELKRDGTIGRSIEVGLHVNKNNNIFSAFFSDEEVRPSDLDRLLAENVPLNKIVNSELTKKLNSQKLGPSLEYAEMRAKEKVNAVRKDCGLPAVPSEDMRCVYYSDEEYNHNVASVLSLYGLDGATAVSNHELIAEIIRTFDGQPSYIVASSAAHELIHRNIDYRTHIYRKLPIDGHPDQAVVQYSLTRTGLAVRDVSHNKFVGGVLNELGNYYVQAEFIRSMLADNNPLIKSDVDIREKNIDERYGKSNIISMKIILPTGRTEEIALNRDKIHFDSSGKIINSDITVFMQLADDIGLLCDRENDIPVMQLLLKAKAQPHLVGQVKKIMDDKVEVGFFKKLKQANSKGTNDLLDLLKLVQSKIYTFA